ncbi:MAG: glycoside hydrolase family 2, partial [Planctomycetes bacterium]|nr:glycoside hydrolase family 2 [Planctomycetota bacterium]
LGITWAPGQLAFHPGQRGEYAVVRWTAPADDAVQVTAVFQSIAERATTDVHVLHGGRELFAGGIHVLGGGGEQRFEGRIAVRAGDALDFCCGFGNGDYGADTTALDVTIQPSLGVAVSAAADFTAGGNPSGPWSYGLLAPGDSPDAATFQRFDAGLVEAPIGGVSNPGSARWEDLLSDKHPYQRVPHTADIIRALRTMDGDGLPLFISEYGIGSAVDLMRVVNLYEQAGKPDVEDALFYRAQRDRFLEDWKRWRLDEAFDRPEEFFAQSNARMAGQRLLGLNAIRSNPAVVGYSLTGTVDQGMTGEGLWTTFRELKPGTADAVFDGFAPLRWCLFAEPVNVYRGTPVRIEALLASEDALPPGEYSVWLRVVGPGKIRVFERQARVSIAEDAGGAEPPMVQPVLSESVVIDGPAGAYRFSATFEGGAAAAGEIVEFFVDDPAAMPPLDEEIVLWGDDALLARWLEARNVRGAGLDASAAGRPQVILAAARPAAPGGAAVFRDLAERIARGSAVVFLSPSVFASEADPVAWMPLESKGALRSLPSWLYHTDEWCKPHAIFDGLPRGGLMDYTFYRELIPDAAWTDLDPPEEAVAGAINASQGYSSGLLVSVHRLGAGHFILNTLSIREHLEHHPAAERLLRNLLRHAASLRRPEPAALPADWDEFLRRIRYE